MAICISRWDSWTLDRRRILQTLWGLRVHITHSESMWPRSVLPLHISHTHRTHSYRQKPSGSSEDLSSRRNVVHMSGNIPVKCWSHVLHWRDQSCVQHITGILLCVFIRDKRSDECSWAWRTGHGAESTSEIITSPGTDLTLLTRHFVTTPDWTRTPEQSSSLSAYSRGDT